MVPGRSVSRTPCSSRWGARGESRGCTIPSSGRAKVWGRLLIQTTHPHGNSTILIHITTTHVDRIVRALSYPTNHWLSLNINFTMTAHFFRYSLTIFVYGGRELRVNKQTDATSEFTISHDSKCVFMAGYRPNDQY